MTEAEWQAICGLLEQGFKGDLDDERRAVYRVLLDGHRPEGIVAALRVMVEEGQVFVPVPGEIVARIRRLNGEALPTWTEAWKAIQRAMNATTPEREAAALEHPALARFVELEGLDVLRQTEFWHPSYGPLRIRDLEARWREFASACEDRVREGRALIGAGRKDAGLRRLESAGILASIAQLEAG